MPSLSAVGFCCLRSKYGPRCRVRSTAYILCGSACSLGSHAMNGITSRAGGPADGAHDDQRGEPHRGGCRTRFGCRPWRNATLGWQQHGNGCASPSRTCMRASAQNATGGGETWGGLRGEVLVSRRPGGGSSSVIVRLGLRAGHGWPCRRLAGSWERLMRFFGRGSRGACR